MTYTERELNSNFAINSASNSDSFSEFNSESDFTQVFMNVDICVFFIL